MRNYQRDATKDGLPSNYGASEGTLKTPFSNRQIGISKNKISTQVN